MCVELKSVRPKRRGRPKPTVVTGYLIFDDSVHIKPKGRRMAGLGRHYSNTEKRVVSGHCLFTGLYLLLGQCCPLPARLYRQQAVCQAEQVPFQSKIDLADRQKHQGMHWSERTSDALAALRTLILNGGLDFYWQKHQVLPLATQTPS